MICASCRQEQKVIRYRGAAWCRARVRADLQAMVQRIAVRIARGESR